MDPADGKLSAELSAAYKLVLDECCSAANRAGDEPFDPEL